MDIKKLKQELLNAIETIVNKKLKDLSFDRTYIAPIVSKTNASTTQYKYEICLGNSKYYVISNVENNIEVVK